jgi:hypothetical protein
MSAVTARSRRRPPAVTHRPVAVLCLDELHGPAAGIIEPPRGIWWSGEPAVNLGDRGQAVLFYDQLLDKGTRDEIAEWASSDLLVGLWPTMGGRSRMRLEWEEANPRLAAAMSAARAAA